MLEDMDILITKDILILWTTPLSFLPKPFRILSIFAASALFHMIISIPLPATVSFMPYLILYLSQGIGCILERYFRNITGKRVGGWIGRIWLWSFMIIGCGGMVGEYYRVGWVGMMRGALVQNGMSPAEGLARWAGLAVKG